MDGGTGPARPNPRVYLLVFPAKIVTTTGADQPGAIPGNGDTLVGWRAQVSSAPVGSNLTASLNIVTRATGAVDSTFATVTIPAGSLTADGTFTRFTLANTKAVALAVTGVGSTTPANDLIVEVYGAAGPGSSGAISPLTTKGDLWGYDTADTRVPVGTDGQVLTADSGNARGVSWQAGGAAAVVAGKVTNSADQSIPDSVDTTLLFDTTVYASTGVVTAGDRLTFPVDGIYLVDFQGAYEGNAGGTYRYLTLRVNGTTGIAGAVSGPNSGVTANISRSVIYAATAGEYVQAQVGQNSGGALVVEANPESSYLLTIHKLSDLLP